MKIKLKQDILTLLMIGSGLIVSLLIASIMFVAQPTHAQTVAEDAESYCSAMGYSIGSAPYFSCVESKQAELDACNSSSVQAERQACVTAALTYTYGAGSLYEDNLNNEFTCENASVKVDCVDAGGNEFLSYLGGWINFAAAGIGAIVALMVVVGGVQYMYSRGNPQAVEAARTRITNALIALGVYLFAFAFLQWLIPGGLFS